jgi:DNA-binding NtrC family response regulator
MVFNARLGFSVQGGQMGTATRAALKTNRAAGILVTSSQAKVRQRILQNLARDSAFAVEAFGGADALLKLRENRYETLLLDRAIEDLDVEEVLMNVRQAHPGLRIVLLDSENEPEQMALGLSRQGDSEASDVTAGPALEMPSSPNRGVREEARALDVPGPRIEALPGMIGRSRKMQHVYRLARLVSPRDTAVLIVGATGTGKELVARGIHDLSKRNRGPFVVVNCAAIPESLLEAELFGFTRGAFTGAFQSRLGRIHAAHGGTLLLDEIGELPLSMQAKLLRFVQEGEVQRLGSADLFRVDARLIAATNADLLQKVAEKQFREDLYYRLAVFPIDLPPLKSRVEDILPVSRHLLDRLCREAGTTLKAFTTEAERALEQGPWPGNVRELQHSIERAFVLAEDRDEIGLEELAMPAARA